ncbi:MAG: hypothetical protein OXI01_13325 [Albidovulum sp.]|nr:hypothetical protein [Albidovulum sp.]
MLNDGIRFDKADPGNAEGVPGVKHARKERGSIVIREATDCAVAKRKRKGCGVEYKAVMRRPALNNGRAALERTRCAPRCGRLLSVMRA